VKLEWHSVERTPPPKPLISQTCCCKQTPRVVTILGQETQLSLTNRATRLEVIQGHQTWYHTLCYVWFPISVL